MTFQDMEKMYPNREIKLIPTEYETQYKKWGFFTIDTCNESAFGKDYNYCFMVEAIC